MSHCTSEVFPCLNGSYLNRKNFDQAHFVTISLYQDSTNEESFCDFTIRVDDQQFKVHKSVLGVLSPYFRKMFLSDMVEKRQNETNMDGISVEVMRIVIDYIYTGKFEADMDNIYDVVAAADYMQLALVQNRCSEYLIDQLSVSNVVATWLCSTRYKIKTLEKNAEGFIVRNLMSLVETGELLELNRFQLDGVIKICNNKTPAALICKCLLSWVQHTAKGRKKYFVQMFGHIDLRHVNIPGLLDIKESESVKNSLVCLTRILNVMNLREADDFACSSSKCAIISRSKHSTKIQLFDSSTETWSVLPEIPRSFYEEKTTAVIFSKHGAYAMNDDLSRFRTLDLQSTIKQWSESKPMSGGLRRDKFGCTVWNDYIYVVGGEITHPGSWDDRLAPKAVRLHLPEQRWVDDENMLISRHEFVLINAGEKLYAIGGLSSDAEILDTAECYDGAAWKMVSPMHEARHDFAAVVLNGQIYVMGGWTSEEDMPTSTAERYDPVTDSWCHIPSMTKPRCGHSACVHNGKIYVVDGRDEVEVYDSKKYVWYKMGKRENKSQ
ncbi:kelch-like protein 26 [Clavelina lepadiformis]|uniref:kelch-like protein 26 n=1 Tax=Clavelina lepadiformis TaxID=159417 RepID=UPI004042CE42